MTDETHDVVSRARAALDGITPGPWVRDNPDDRFSEHDDVFSGDVWSRRVAGLISRRADARFIAAAPDLVRDLAAEVERLEADLDGAAYRAGRKQGELAEARAAVDRVRKLVNGTQTDALVSGFAAMVSVDAVIDALDKEAGK